MGRSRVGLSLSVLFLSLSCTVILASEDNAEDLCQEFRNCKDCIQKAGSECGWCPQFLRNGSVRGCINVRNEGTCEGFNGEGPKEEKLEDKPTSKSNLIAPQKVRISMRPHEKYSVDFKVMKDENDVDIYFLLDNTFSMKKYKKQLSSIAINLGEKISTYTTKYMFGFGAFDEKSTPPFSATEKNPKNFVHYLDLTNDTKKFSKEVDDSAILSNTVLNDSPEAGLDGLVQVINCKDIIGWRDGIMHLIIYISDASFHFAGDGLYAGIWKPYNGSCQLEWDQEIGRYIYQGLRYDYPSISEANYWLHQHNKYLIFGVTKKLMKLYKTLDEEGALTSSTGDIGDGTGEEIHEIVISEFRKIADKLSVEFRHDDTIEIELKQLGKRNRKTETENMFTLHGVKVNEIIDLQAQISIGEDACRDPSAKLHADFTIAGHKGHNFEIEVSPICECDCKSEQSSNSTARCNCHGTSNCGVCECDEGYAGEFCQCSTDEDLCRPETVHKSCNNQGYLRCEECVCIEGFTGQNCEHTECEEHELEACTDPITQAKLCNGPTHGTCVCGECLCNGNKNEESGIWFEGDFCQIASESNTQVGAVSTCDKLVPCVKTDILADNEDIEKWKDECSAFSIRQLYECYNVNDKTKANGRCPQSVLPENETLKECQLSYQNCPVKFWHDGLEDYTKETELSTWNRKVYVDFSEDMFGQESCMDPLTKGELCNGNGACVCGRCECNGPVDGDAEIIFSGDFCEIASKSDKLTGTFSMCDMLAPCVKKDVFPDDEQSDVWEAECSAYPVNTYYKCNSVFEDDDLVLDDGFRSGFEEVGNVACYPDKFPDSTHLEQCYFVHGDCPLKFWHDRSESYKLDTEFKTWQKTVYVEYFKEGEAWTPLACEAISATYIVIICVSILVTIAIGLFVAYVIIVNLQDRREYNMFWEAANDTNWSTQNQLYESVSDRSSLRQRVGFTNQGLVGQN
eukprot:GFUD01028277.1.p1 GENE.GFUD01028277.1~~GFUD01028277.1.p1  ORF type:complete len:967 (-),score=196.84 GFUD01028277.1:167-3067(-)